jgi:hypothetical protein
MVITSILDFYILIRKKYFILQYIVEISNLMSYKGIAFSGTPPFCGQLFADKRETAYPKNSAASTIEALAGKRSSSSGHLLSGPGWFDASASSHHRGTVPALNVFLIEYLKLVVSIA